MQLSYWTHFSYVIFDSCFSPKTSVFVSATLLGLILVGRAAFVFPLSLLSNLARKSPSEKKISFKQQVCSHDSYSYNFDGLWVNSRHHVMAYADYDMVGWSHARCSFYGSRLQPGNETRYVMAPAFA